MMGSTVTTDAPPVITAEVFADEPIERVELLRGTDVIYTHYGCPEPDGAEPFKTIKILWSGVRNTARSKLANWDGSLFLDRGRITGAEAVAFDCFQQGITYTSSQRVSWTSATAGDIDGLKLTLDAPDGAVLRFRSAQADFDATLSELSRVPKVYPAGGVNLQVEIYRTGVQPAENEIKLEYTDTDYKDSQNAYWVKVTLANGQMAFSSPVLALRPRIQ
jgi:hypothetical protein